MRLGLLALMAIVTTCVILLTCLPHSDPFAAELKRDLNLPSPSQIWIVGKRRVDRAIAISETNGVYKIFSAARITESGSLSKWFVSFNVLNVRPEKHAFKLPHPLRPNLKGADVAQTYDHFPTGDEIGEFLAAHSLDP